MSVPDDQISVLLLGSQMATGGAQNVLFIQARWLHEHGYRCKVVFLRDKEGLYDQWRSECPCPLVNLDAWRNGRDPRNPFRLARGLVNLYKLMRRERFTVVEAFTHHPNLLGLPIAWLAGIPVRLASHHGHPENFPPPLERLHSWMINSSMATNIVAVSNQARRQAIDEGIKQDKITTILNGIEIPAISAMSDTERDMLKRSLGVGLRDNLILTVGRLTTPKGHAYLLDAIPEVLAHFPNTMFVFAGNGYLRTALEARAGELGIADSVRFLGNRTDVPDLLSISDIFVLPSLWEGLPIALLEAMMVGVPVIATTVAGVEDIIVDSRNGMLVPATDPQALSEKIIHLLGNDQLRIQLGQAGSVLIREKYTAEHMCRNYESLFRATREVNL